MKPYHLIFIRALPKVAFFALLVLLSFISQAQTTLYSETFTVSNGTTSGTGNPAKWTRNTNGQSPTTFSVQSNVFTNTNTAGEVIWQSQVIPIYGWSTINASVYLPTVVNMEVSDYIKVYYKLNGGAETIFSTNGSTTGNYTNKTASTTPGSGNTLQIVVRVLNNASNEIHYIDNVTVTGTNTTTTLYTENFTASNGTTTGTGSPAKWTRDISGTSPSVASVQSNVFTLTDVDGEAEWYSQSITISSYSNISASVYLPTTINLGTATDYIRVYYKLNGGAETLFTTNGDNAGNYTNLTATVSGLSGTSLQIVIRVANQDADETHYIDNVSVTGAPAITALSVSSVATNPNCNTSNGIVDVSVSGGRTPYSFSWSNGTTTEDLSGLAAGTYTVTVTSNSGATATTSKTLTEIGTVSLSATSANPTQYGRNNGSVDLTASGGTTPYTYLWSNAATSQDVSGLVAGTYTVTVTSAAGCTVSTSKTLTNPALSSNDFTACKTITIDESKVYGSSTFSNFPVLINTTQNYLRTLANGGDVTNSNGYDIIFTDSAGTTILSHQLEKYTATTGELVAWVKIPSLYAARNTTIRIYYGNSYVTSDLSTSSTWNSNYTSVWHLEQASTTDATSNSNDGTGQNSPTLTTSGKIGNAISLDGVNDYISTANSINDPQNFTISAWFKTNTASGKKIIAFESNQTGTGSGSYDRMLYIGTDGKLYFGSYDGTADVAVSASTYNNNAWHHVVGVRDDAANIIYLYVDGAAVNNVANANAQVFNGYWRMGSYKTTGWTVGADGYFTGTIDEVHISNTALSANWIHTEYDNQNSPSTFYAISACSNLSASAVGTNPACFGGSNGSVNLTATSNYTPLTYLWSNGATTEDVSALSAGSYTVTVTDNVGVTVSASVTLSNPGGGMSLSYSNTNTTCPIASNGAINLTVTGGNGSKTYQWSSGGTTEDISSLIADVYSVTVTDATGCTVTGSTTVSSVSTLSSTMAITHVTTAGGSNGAITQTVTGGSSPYTYTWSNGATTKDISGLIADGYTVTITDNSSCQYIYSGIVVEKTSLYCEDFSSYSNGATSASGSPANWTQTCGSCTATGANGDWEVISNKWQADDLDATGVWTSKVIDISGYENVQATVNLTATNNMESSDSIKVLYKLNGGLQTYFTTNGNNSGNLSGGAVIASESGLIGSTLQIIIRVLSNGTGEIHTFDNVCVTGDLALDLAFSQTNVTCNGGSNGSIDLTVYDVGATPPFTYSWSNGGATTQDISGLAAGTYTVTVTGYSSTGSYSQEVAAGTSDADQTSGGTMDLVDTKLSFTSTNTVGVRFTSVTVPVGAIITSAYVEFVAQAANSGSCNFTFTGHDTDNGGVFTSGASDITNRTQTSASVTWSSVANWSAGTAYQSSDISSVISEITSRSGWASGNSIVLRIASTGTRNAASNEHATYAAPKLFVTYAIPISKTGSVTITQPTALTASISATNTTCPTSTNGAANLTAGGGTAPRTYLWSNGITSEDLTGLTTGSYTVTVTDAKGCTKTANTTVSSTSNISSTMAVTNITIPGGSDGAINQTVTGASGAKTYLWSNGATSEDLSSLAMGTYTVTITDAAGCTKTKSAMVLDPESISCQNFSAYSNGTTTSSEWTQTCASCTQINFDVQSGQWAAYDLDNVGVWTSSTINISGYSSVRMSVDLSETDVLESNDYIRVYYKLNGGAETLFATNGDKTDDFTSATAVQTGLSGLTLQIVVRIWNDAEHHYFDNICVYGYPPFYLDTEPTHLICHGGANGAIDLTVTNATGVPPFTYNWSNGATTQDPTGLSGGTYNVTVTDDGGLTRTTQVTLTEPASSMSVNNTIVNVTCHGGSDATVILAVNGGVSPYTFQWSNGSNSMNPSGLSAGTYTVTITDASGCTTSNNYVVSSPTLPLDMTFTGTASLCAGSSTQLTASGAQNFTWTPSTGLSATNIANPIINPGSTTTYYVTASSPGASNLVANGDFESGNIGFTTQYSYTTNNLVPEGRYGIGTNAHTYHSNFYSSGDHTSGSGKFMVINGAVTINQQVWCQNLNVQQGASYAFSTYISSVHPSNPAQLEFSINGTLLGTPITAPSARYVWNQFTANWTSNTTNANFCIVNRNTIAGGNDFALDDIVIMPTCSDVDTITVTVNTLPLPDADADGGANQTICYGATANLLASGGANYSWSNSVTGATNNVSPTSNTTYTVTVTSAAGCTASDNVNVTVRPQLTLTVDSVKNTVCSGVNNGRIYISMSGGTGPYTYAWSHGPTSQDVTGLGEGTYTVTVTDAANCTISASRTITDVTIEIELTKTDISCNSVNDGSINLSATGGTPPYTYAWSTGTTAQNIAGLSAGTFTVTVTGSNGCTASNSATVVNPTVLTPSAAVTNITCNGLTNGAIDLSVSGGWTPYTYNWGGGVTTQDRTALAVASYTVTVTDSRSCTATLTRPITQPAVLNTSKSVTNESCNGGSNGAIDLTVSGGTSPFTYVWSTGTTTQDLTSKLADEYFVTVTDAHSCTKIDSAIITEPTDALSASLTITDVTCTGIEDGTVTIDITGGTAPYTRLVLAGNLPGPTDSTSAFYIGYASSFIDSLPPLALTFIITDASGCSTTVSGDMGSEGPILSLTETNINCSGGATGAIDLTVNGEEPFTYNWSNGATTEDLSAIVSGAYDITVTDANGCIGVGWGDITQPSFSGSISVTNTTCPNSTNGAADLTITDGVAPFSYAWSNGATSEDLINVASGSYTVTVTDAAECTISEVATISAQSNIASNLFILDVTVHAGTDGKITQTLSGGIAPYSYAWSNGATSKDLIGIAAGNYTVTITDANTCTLTKSATVNAPGACPCAWLGTTNNSWSVASNWDCGLVPTDTCNVTVQPAANICTILAGTGSCRNLTIQPGATLVIINAAGIDIYGNLVNNGTFTRNSSTVRFASNNEQTISGSSRMRFYNLQIQNKSATGVRMTKSIEVHNELRLIDGYLFTGTDSVKMMSSEQGKVSGFSSSSFVVGRLYRKISNTIDAGYEFPVGDAGTPTRYFKTYIKSFKLQGTTSLTVWFDTLRQHSNAQLTSAYYNPPTNVNSYYNYNVPYVKISAGDTLTSTNFGLLAGVVNGVIDGVTGTVLTTSTTYLNNVFNMEKTVETDGIMYSFMAPEGIWHFEPDQQPTGGYYHMVLDIQNFSGLSDNNFGVLKRPTGANGTYWSAGGGNMKPFGGEGRRVSDGFAMRMYLTTFSEGGAGGGGGGGLPIELLDFKADLIGDDVELTWVTATEINNDYFTIEKSNGTEFKQIAIIPGAGNSSSTKYYSKIDYEPFIGTSYYRLKQTDYDGHFTYSDVVSVTYEPANHENEDDELIVYPNPSGGNFSVVVKNASEEVILTLFDNRGKLVMTETYSADEDNYTHQVTVKGIPSGIYYLKADMGEKIRYTKKLMLFGEE